MGVNPSLVGSRVKSGNFSHQVNSDSDVVGLVSYFNYWNENKLTKQKVKMQMRQHIRSRLI